MTFGDSSNLFSASNTKGWSAGYNGKTFNVNNRSELFYGIVGPVSRSNVILGVYNVILANKNREILYNVPVFEGTLGGSALNGAGKKAARLNTGDTVVLGFVGDSRAPQIISVKRLTGDLVRTVSEGSQEYPLPNNSSTGSQYFYPNVPATAATKFCGETNLIAGSSWKASPDQVANNFESVNSSGEYSLAPTGNSTIQAVHVTDGSMSFSAERNRIHVVSNHFEYAAGVRVGFSEMPIQAAAKEYEVSKVEFAQAKLTPIIPYQGYLITGSQSYDSGASYGTATFTGNALDVQLELNDSLINAEALASDLLNWLASDLVPYLLDLVGLWGVLNQTFGLDIVNKIKEFDHQITDWAMLDINIPIIGDLIEEYVSLVFDLIKGIFVGAVSLLINMASAAVSGIPGLLGAALGALVSIVGDIIDGEGFTILTVICRTLELEEDFALGPPSFASLIDGLISIVVNAALSAVLNLFKFEDVDAEVEEDPAHYYESTAISVMPTISRYNTYHYPYHRLAVVLTQSGLEEAGLLVQAVHDLSRTGSLEAYARALSPILPPKLLVVVSSAISFYLDEPVDYLEDLLFSSGQVSCNSDIKEFSRLAIESETSNQVVNNLRDYFVDDNIPYFEEWIEDLDSLVNYLEQEDPTVGKAARLLYENDTIEYLKEATKIKTGEDLDKQPRVLKVLDNYRYTVSNIVDLGYETT